MEVFASSNHFLALNDIYSLARRINGWHQTAIKVINHRLAAIIIRCNRTDACVKVFHHIVKFDNPVLCGIGK